MTAPCIAILSRRPDLYSTRRLVAAAEHLGAVPLVLDPGACLLALDSAGSVLYHGTERLVSCAAAIPRIGSPITRLGGRLLRHFASEGSYCLNGAAALELARDKFAALQVLVQAGVPVPTTVYFSDPQQREMAMAQVGWPLVSKLLEGSQGVGVMLAESAASARGLLDTLLHLQQEAVVQRYLAGREDIRVIVLAGQILAAMRRRAPLDDFRSNLHRGGEATPVGDLPAAWAAIALRATTALGLDFAGVDLMADGDGQALVLEVNPVPSLEGIERVSGVDIADAIMRRVLAAALPIPHPSGRRPG
ncbi:MAG: ATP-grasp domain-containing protein [Acidithiobacillus sp.]